MGCCPIFQVKKALSQIFPQNRKIYGLGPENYLSKITSAQVEV